MGDSLGRYVRALRPRLPPGLFPEAAIARMEQLAGILPAARNAGFECRLGDGRGQVDLLCAYAPEWTGLPELERCAGEQGWPALAQFLRAWREQGSRAVRQVNLIWLEFDLTGRESVPSPSLFVRVARPEGANDSFWRDVLDVIVRPLQPSAGDAVRGALVGVPAAARGVYLGFMLAREGVSALRINLPGLERRELLDYVRAHLPATSWRGDPERLVQRLDALVGRVDSCALNLDIGDTAGARVGLECRVDETEAGRARWRRFLEQIGAEGLCRDGEREELLAWPGTDPCPPDGPAGPAALAAFLGGGSFVIARALNHVKIDIDSEHRETAKAYLWFGPRWERAVRDAAPAI